MKTQITEIVQRIKNKHLNVPVSEDKDQIVELILSHVEELIPRHL
jgi:hemoglobin-like flavoprotein